MRVLVGLCVVKFHWSRTRISPLIVYTHPIRFQVTEPVRELKNLFLERGKTHRGVNAKVIFLTS